MFLYCLFRWSNILFLFTLQLNFFHAIWFILFLLVLLLLFCSFENVFFVIFIIVKLACSTAIILVLDEGRIINSRPLHCFHVTEDRRPGEDRPVRI